MVNSNSRGKAEVYIDREVRTNLKGKRGEPLPDIIPAAEWTLPRPPLPDCATSLL